MTAPKAPGVPPLKSGDTSAAAPPQAMTADSASVGVGKSAPQWGIFKDGSSVITADNVVAFEYKQEWSLSDYPIEQGGFESYDKVNSPFDARVEFSRGGSEDERSAFLQTIGQISETLDLYDVATPEIILPNCNIIHYDYRRTATNGVGIIKVAIWLLEVRVTATASFTQTKAPSGAKKQNDGTVQSKAPTTNQANAVNGRTGGGSGGGGGGGW